MGIYKINVLEMTIQTQIEFKLEHTFEQAIFMHDIT